MKHWYLFVAVSSWLVGVWCLINNNARAVAFFAFSYAASAHRQIVILREDTANFTDKTVKLAEAIADAL